VDVKVVDLAEGDGVVSQMSNYSCSFV